MARRWLVAAVLLVALGGCGDEPEAEPATVPVPVTTSPVPASPSVVASRVAGAAAPARTTAARTTPQTPRAAGWADPAAFVAVVQRTMPDLALDRREDELATLAQRACAALAAGRSPAAVVAEVRAFGTDRAGARQLIKLAVDTVCPEQERRAREF
ncbi:DUF732 domain-containing protein [Actinoplanes auranticolor]|uniref:DUF732 domain-containing protein n=1 Tax=Actinoplanes auranticolor TaxID=47988 RepID=A0A919VZ37_9ACTN|nr:DUF732 domain-containing protein [Actinoplanes auranticolor]GIM80035.1 hypothetical protein Aau02nite_88690 [Actinoplanes auranticolor]